LVISPMLATAGAAPSGDGWAFEWKWDGMRGLVHIGSGQVRIMSRNNRDVTPSYPELRGVFPDREAVFDGEIVACGSDGAPSFGELQKRMHVARPTPALVAGTPVTMHLFDLLYLDGRDLTGLPYVERRVALEGLDVAGERLQVPPYHVGVTAEHMLACAAEHGLEGVVAKRLTSTYAPGRRSPAWVKIPLRRTVDVTVVGWQPGGGKRAGRIGSLLVSVPAEDGRLRYAGEVGTGFTEAALADMARRLAPLRRDTPPVDGVPRPIARHAHWVEPVLVGEVQFRQWTGDGRLRHPSWKGIRFDKEPPAPLVEGAMATRDGQWRVEVWRRGGVSWYQLQHAGAVLDWLNLGQLQAILGRAGVDMASLGAA
jgi:bifunctional non-homologous end joining protein LigD